VDPRSRPWTIRSAALCVTGVISFLLYVPTQTWWYVALGVLFLAAATVASVTANRRGEK
jgi:uncharacterized protein (DUF58 family)